MDTVNIPYSYLAEPASVGYSDLVLLNPGTHISG